jgi:hypothetical protein
MQQVVMYMCYINHIVSFTSQSKGNMALFVAGSISVCALTGYLSVLFEESASRHLYNESRYCHILHRLISFAMSLMCVVFSTFSIYIQVLRLLRRINVHKSNGQSGSIIIADAIIDSIVPLIMIILTIAYFAFIVALKTSPFAAQMIIKSIKSRRRYDREQNHK